MNSEEPKSCLQGNTPIASTDDNDGNIGAGTLVNQPDAVSTNATILDGNDGGDVTTNIEINNQTRECRVKRAANHQQRWLEMRFAHSHETTFFTIEPVLDESGFDTDVDVEVLYSRFMENEQPVWYRAEALDDGASGTFSNETKYNNGAEKYKKRHFRCNECNHEPCVWSKHRATIIPAIKELVKLHDTVHPFTSNSDPSVTLSPWLYYLYSNLLEPLYDIASNDHNIPRDEVTGRTVMLLYVLTQYRDKAGYHHKHARFGLPVCLVQRVERRVTLVRHPPNAIYIRNNDANITDHQLNY